MLTEVPIICQIFSAFALHELDFTSYNEEGHDKHCMIPAVPMNEC